MTPPKPTHTVLIVEDEEDLRELMRDALLMRGYCVVTAEEGTDALRKIDDLGPPCVILLDLLMPGMNGWEFFDKVRERPELSSVPVIIHSSAAARAPAGATRVLQKPLAFERLVSIVAEYCGN
ncbi:MAG TPA: response regulator [Polyangiaceae bacterium]|jgi:CheY-like chemotaxis protein|nr:response regulator [Polyangiaceae bacterium]